MARPTRQGVPIPTQRKRPACCSRVLGPPVGLRITHGLVSTADLATPLTGALAPRDWVLCLEVGEHIPARYESTFLANLDALNVQGAVISWAVSRNGHGHVNPHPNSWAIEKFQQRGYTHDVQAQRALRASVATLAWFRTTLLVFRRQR